jgi:hypothetical protein
MAASETRLLLEEMDCDPSSTRSWRNLLDLAPRKMGAKGIFKTGDRRTIPSFEELELIPRGEITLLARESGRGLDAVYIEQRADYHGYPGDVKDVWISLTPNAVRFVSLGAHRTEGLASRVALFGINESAMRSAVIEICQMQVGGEIMSPYFPLALRP